MSIKRAITLGLVIAPWILLWSQVQGEQKGETLPELPEGVAAQVGDRIITHSDVLERIFEVEQGMPGDDQHLRNAYQYLMELALLRNEAENLGIEISEEERLEATERQINLIKSKVAYEYSNAVPWSQYLSENGFNESSFHDFIYKQVERYVLMHRVVGYFQLTAPSATYSEMRLIRYEDALKIKEKLDAGENFETLALLNSIDKQQGVRVAFKHQGLTPQIEELLFDTLEPGSYSEIVNIGEKDYRIVMLKSRSDGNEASYAEMESAIYEAYPNEGDVPRDRFDQWVAVMYNTGKYTPRYRFPNQVTKSTSTQHEKDVK